MNQFWNKSKNHLLAIGIFVVLSSLYFTPMFEGRKLAQSDMMHWKGMYKEIESYRDKTGEEPLWTNSMFGGMPAYLIGMRQPGNLIVKIHAFINVQSARPAIHVFLYMLGFYILLQFMGIHPFLAISGAIAYGFSSYLFIILVPGHLTKAMALGYMPMIIGAVYYTYKTHSLQGALLSGIFISLQLITNHLQITYYTFLILLIFIILEIFRVIKETQLQPFVKTSSYLLIGLILAVLTNITNIWSVYEYSSYSMRGPSEITVNTEEQTSGLNRDYITGWSYGKGETFNLLIPNFKGGASDHLFREESQIFKYLTSRYGPQNAVQVYNQNPGIFAQYWGDQPGTSGPVYLGATVVFLFVLGLFLVKGRLKWWLLSATILSILLAWGRNFYFLTDLFINYFPGYTRFRTVSMILVIAELTVPLLGILAIHRLFTENIPLREVKKALLNALMITGGICLLFALAPSVSNLSGPVDEFLVGQGMQDWVQKLKADRADLLSRDAFRSLLFVIATATLVFLWKNKTINYTAFLVLLPVLFLADLWPVNKRYLNDSNFVPKKAAEVAFTPYEADLLILQDPEPYFRVYDLTGSPFNSSRASYFHKSIGGYHGAKMRRYQDLIDQHVSKGNEKVLNMLNTKYLIVRPETGNKPEVVLRDTKLGNAWFVNNYKLVENPDGEIAALNDFEPAKEAVIDSRFARYVEGKKFIADTSATIQLKTYAPNRLVYEFSSATEQLTIFSDIYYSKGWKLYVNEKDFPYFRANYVLRAAVLPAGNYRMEFVFRPASYFTANKIALAASLLLILGVLYPFARPFIKRFPAVKDHSPND